MIRAALGGMAALAAASSAGFYWIFMSPYSQIQGEFPYRGKVNGSAVDGKIVALTFDDGPNEPYTSQIAAFLDERGIKATFFQPGACVERFPEVTTRLALSGHVIGSHAYSHQFGRYLTLRSVRHEIEQADAVFAQHLGALPALYRPPWLLRMPGVLDHLRQCSLQSVSGEFCHALEIFQPDPTRIARRAIAKVKPGSIIIFHDGFDAKGGNRSQTVEAVKITVDRLADSGYQFTTVDKLLGVPAYRPLRPPSASTQPPSTQPSLHGHP
ncbi:MAG: polysaccharide deacetylase family protein [Acidimicrobiales bacterium]